MVKPKTCCISWYWNQKGCLHWSWQWIYFHFFLICFKCFPFLCDCGSLIIMFNSTVISWQMDLFYFFSLYFSVLLLQNVLDLKLTTAIIFNMLQHKHCRVDGYRDMITNLFWKHSWKLKDMKRKSLSLCCFCCLLVVRDVLTEVFGYVLAFNSHETSWFVWPRLSFLFCVLLENSGHLGLGFTGTPTFCRWNTQLPGFNQRRLIFFQVKKKKVMVKTISEAPRLLQFCFCHLASKRNVFQWKLSMNGRFVRQLCSEAQLHGQCMGPACQHRYASGSEVGWNGRPVRCGHCLGKLSCTLNPNQFFLPELS